MSKWEALIDNLSNKEFSELVSNQEFRYLLVYDAIRVKAEVWNRQFFRHDTPTELSTTTQTLITNVETTIKHASKLEHKIGNMANEVSSLSHNS